MIERVQKRRLELLNLPQHDLSRDRIVAALDKLEKGNPTIAVCDKEELDILTRLLGDSDKAKGRFYELGRQICPELKDITSDREDDVREKLAHHRSVLLVAAGLQTGVTLQHLVVSVQNVFRDLGADPAMHGLVLHAHPNDSAAWTSVRNSFGGRRNPALLALWLTYLPSVSPFAEEFELLRVGQNEWFEGFPKAREVWEQRIAWLNTSGGGAARDPVPVSPLFAATEVTLRRTSIYGSLNDRHLLPAMGAALTEALERQKTDGSPEWVQIDLLNALRSYFDGLLHAALIRWVSPQRAWWGTANDCVALIDELRGRFFNDDWPLLLCELLLAAAQGKVPDAGVELLLGYAEEDEARLTDEARGYLELAVLLVKNLWRPAAA
ncbi:MAG: hypothetical protein N2037_12615 [Acidimicrobiales bacterium]|nr:hypothetical protein [Acidimicrobiales bacterium]